MKQFIQSCLKAVRIHYKVTFSGRGAIPKIILDALKACWTAPELFHVKSMSELLSSVSRELTTNVMNHIRLFYQRQLHVLKREPFSDDMREQVKATITKPTDIKIRNKIAETRQKLINSDLCGPWSNRCGPDRLRRPCPASFWAGSARSGPRWLIGGTSM